MGSLDRHDFSLGWCPDCDAVNGPANALLRMDNGVLDELGAVSLRQGSAKINGSAFSDVDVHSLFTTSLSGTRYRMAGATAAVYANGTSISSSINGSNDIYFGAAQGQILFARGTTKKKYDGTTVRNLGIAAFGAAPTLSALSSDSKVFASCASTESPVMTSNEGTQAFTTDRSSTANAAVSLTPDSTTARATSTKTFAGATDFTAYDGGQTGTDDDPIEMYAYFTEPQYVDRVSLMIDVNDGTFQVDYYQYDFINGKPTEVQLTDEQYLRADYSSEGFDRSDVLARLESRPIESSLRLDKPVSDAGWTLLSVPRGAMRRVGLTAGKDWTTVKAVRIVYVALAGGSGALARFDAIQIIGGSQRPLTGKYKAIVVAVNNNGTYNALSPVSTASAEIGVRASGIRATLDATTVNAMDSQVNELWLYLMGGRLDGYYRAAVKTGGPFSGAQTIDATSSDRAMLINNFRLETDNAVPPSTIIGIEGPHYDRTFYLTATTLYPSRRLNPDSCSTGEAVTIGSAAETALWIKRLHDYLYVGTTSDIYRISGDWTPQPNGVLNIIKRPLGVNAPPVSAAVAVGNINGVDGIVYHASDGWRVLDGPLLTADKVSLLWRGYTRHGVSPVNTTGTTARFRCAIAKNCLYAITPEGSDTTSSTTLHVYSFALQRWYRWTYASSWRSIAAEPDGTLIAGSTAGFVWDMDEATKQDGGSDIAMTVWTKYDDSGEGFLVKDPQSLLLECKASTTVSIAVWRFGDSAADASFSSSADTGGTSTLDISSASEFQQVQLRLTGSFSDFTLRGFSLRYLDRPVPLVYHDTGFVDLTDTTLAWCRFFNFKARADGNFTFTPYYDGTAGTARTVTVTAGKEKVYRVPLGREDKGTTVRGVLTSAAPSNVYWAEWEYNVSGKQRQKRVKVEAEK